MTHHKLFRSHAQPLQKSCLPFLSQSVGDIFSNSLSDSVHQTVLKRIGIAKQSIFEIRAVLEDTRADKVGSINVAFEIWEKSVLPMIFMNSKCWFEISNKTMMLLKGLFSQFFSSIFRVTGCPTPSFYWFRISNNMVQKITLAFICICICQRSISTKLHSVWWLNT